MDRVGVRELRQNLSVYLRRVRRGEALEVTERGQPVALLTPLGEGDVWSRLEARRLRVRRGEGNLADLPPPRPARPGPAMSVILDELREERP